jgi:hypothetical protein
VEARFEAAALAGFAAALAGFAAALSGDRTDDRDFLTLHYENEPWLNVPRTSTPTAKRKALPGRRGFMIIVIFAVRPSP